MSNQEDDLAYGEYNTARGSNSAQQGDRGVIGDTFRYLKGRYQTSQQSHQTYGQNFDPSQPYSSGPPGNSGTPSGQQQYGSNIPGYIQNQSQYGQGSSGSYNPNPSQENNPPYAGGPPYQNPQQQPDLASKLFGGLHGAIAGIGTDLAGKLGGHYEPQPYGSQGGYTQPGYSAQGAARNRFDSFASPKNGNDVKWHVDGCEYMWAVSRALEGARESIWILDWWLSPELYLRRPPSKNEQYRLDRMLQRAAQRGVRVNIIVYKEVTQALTRKYLSHTVPDYLHSLLPRSTDAITSTLVRMGLLATAVSMEYVEAENPLIEPPLTVSSSHTKHALEGLHPNISVFRHPDHLPDAQTIQSSLTSSFQNMSLNAAAISRMGADALKGIYGMSDNVILYWAHHEKLCLIDGTIAFMGGLDLCFGRWDTHSHPIADVHPSDLNSVVFPGQDYNNARIMDFSDVAHPDQNKLDRRHFSRMGWSDISVSLQGPCVQDLRRHFVDRWNFIYNEKYNVRKDVRYSRLSLTGSTGSQGYQQSQPPQPPSTTYNTLQPQPSYPVSNTPSSRPQSSYGTNQPQFPPPPGTTGGIPQPSWQSGAQSGAQGGVQSYAQSGAQGHASLPAYQEQQQQNLYGLPVPAWQSSGHPQSPQPSPKLPLSQPQHQGHFIATQEGQYYPPPPPGGPPHISPSSLPSTQSNQQSQYGATEQGQYYPPPPGGGPPHISPSPSPLPQYGQQNDSYGYEPPTHSQYDSAVAELEASAPSNASQYVPYSTSGQNVSSAPAQQTRGIDDYNTDYSEETSGERGFGGKTARYRDEGQRLGSELTGIANLVSGRVENELRNVQGKIIGGHDQYGRPLAQPRGVMNCQIVRSCTKWSNGTATEHSVQDAYIGAIQNSQHFVYIENQFFITATGDMQKPVRNQIGKALVDRILRAARNGESYKVIVLIPSVPGFAGDLRDDSALGTRAIMEFQYNSINRGGHSIMELIGQAGFNPMDYIRFYNLRNYDRLNVNNMMQQAERQSGVNYEDARVQNDDALASGYGNYGAGTATSVYNPGQQYQHYQQAAHELAAQKPPSTGSDRWDSVSECYMLGGEDIRNVPWDYPGEISEIDAFVSEELYIHSKVLIVDDRVVICGSANLNDRSQLGTHDSEIAVVIEDSTPVHSSMAGRPWQASRFAASLRRQLIRKHLGLLRPQDMQRPDANFEPVGVPSNYDWGSPEDNVVADPLSDTFQSLWNSRARQNTEIFRKVFRCVPDDNVTNWTAYKEFYEYYFNDADVQAEGKEGHKMPPRYLWGHIVRDDFPPGAEGIRQVKDLLSRVKGTLVEMPLMFLSEEDIAKEGISLNGLTEEVYT